MTKTELAEAFKIWESLAKRTSPPDGNEESELAFWLRDASPDDLWKAVRAVYLKGVNEVPY